MKSRTEVEASASTSAAELLRLREDLTVARKASIDAEERWLADGGRKTADLRREAIDRVELLTAREKRAAEKYESGAAKLAALEREDRLRELADLRASLSTVDVSIETAGAQFAQLDRAVDVLHLETAAVAVKAGQAHDRAIALAAELRVPHGLGRRPNLADVCLAVQRHVTRVRAAEGRDPIAPHWLAEAPDAGDWKRAGYTAEELRATKREIARTRQSEQEARFFARGALAVANAPLAQPEPPKTTTETTIQ